MGRDCRGLEQRQLFWPAGQQWTKEKQQQEGWIISKQKARETQLRKWEFICSYPGIFLAGAGVYLTAAVIYSAFLLGSGRGLEMFFPAFLTAFPKGMLIPAIALFIFLAVGNVFLIRREGFGTRRFIGSTFGLFCVLINLIGSLWPIAGILASFFDITFLGTSVMGLAAVLHRPSMENDYLIILGSYIGQNGKLVPLLKMRLNKALRFAWQQEIATGKSICYVPCGGQGEDEIMSEGSAMALYLLSHSAEEHEILPEKKSRNTYENFLFSKKLIEEQKKDATISFITTNYHLLRSGMLAKKAGLRAEGLGSATRWYFWPVGFIREYAALMSLNILHLRRTTS